MELAWKRSIGFVSMEAVAVRLPKAVGTQVRAPEAMSARHKTAEFRGHPAGLQFCLAPGCHC